MVKENMIELSFNKRKIIVNKNITLVSYGK